MSKVKFLVAVMLSVLVAACSEEENLSQADKTGFHVSLTEDVKVDSRSTPEEIGKPLASQFNLKITNQATGNTVHDALFKGKEGETEFIPAAAGTYDIEATYGDNPVLALDDPYYKGMAKDVVLEDGESKTVSLNCTVANALTSVVFSDDFAKQFSDYGVEVLVSGNRTTIKGKESAYYRAGSTPSFTFKGITTKGEIVEQLLQNDEFNKSATFAAKAHCKISLTIGAVVPGIRVEINKVEVDSVTVSETIPMEWLPKPKVTAEGFTNNTLAMYETETPTAKFNFNLSSALQELKFTLNFTDETYQALNKTYTLSELSEEDKTALTEAGVVLPTIGSKEASLDFTNIVAKFTGSTTGEVLSNVITLDEVRANNRMLEGNQTYTIQTSAPDFNLIVYPGNTWTKQFTANTEITHGNAEVIRNGMTFEYRPVGTEEWISSPDSIIDGLPQDKEKETAYQVRGKFGKHYTEVVDAKTYPAIPLENGDMEKWKEEERGYYYDANIFNSNDPKLRVYYPWDDESFWNTNNDFTTRNRDASTAAFSIVYRYNSFPAVSYTKDANSGTWAAELRNTAAGRGNTSSSESSYDFNNVPGELFIGDISVSESGTEVIPNDSYSINKGKTFASRPTALRFYYKYAPYNTDSWKVYIALYDSEDNIIAENTKTGDKQDSYNFIDVPFNYTDDLNAVPAKIYVYFASSIYSGNQLPYHKMNVTTWYKDSQRTDETLSGSVFIIDDISLIYDK